jgi:hypothetical protein
VIRGKHPVRAMPVLPRRRHEIGEAIEELKRREFDAAARPRRRGLSAAAGPDPGGGFVSGQHGANLGDAAVSPADRGEPRESKGQAGRSTAAGVPIADNRQTRTWGGKSVIWTLASIENSLFSQASMLAAVAASCSRESLNQRITRRRTRSVTVAR